MMTAKLIGANRHARIRYCGRRPERRQYVLDPVLELHNGDGAGIAQNDNWNNGDGAAVTEWQKGSDLEIAKGGKGSVLESRHLLRAKLSRANPCRTNPCKIRRSRCGKANRDLLDF
jgi:hypothetical protein